MPSEFGVLGVTEAEVAQKPELKIQPKSTHGSTALTDSERANTRSDLGTKELPSLLVVRAAAGGSRCGDAAVGTRCEDDGEDGDDCGGGNHGSRDSNGSQGNRGEGGSRGAGESGAQHGGDGCSDGGGQPFFSQIWPACRRISGIRYQVSVVRCQISRIGISYMNPLECPEPIITYYLAPI